MIAAFALMTGCELQQKPSKQALAAVAAARLESTVLAAGATLRSALLGDALAMHVADAACEATAGKAASLKARWSALATADQTSAEFETVERLFKDWLQGCTDVVSALDALKFREQFVTDLETKAPALAAIFEEIARSLAEDGRPGAQVYVASRQNALLMRMQYRLQRARFGGPDARTQLDGLARDAAIISRVMDAMIEGNADVGIDAFTRPADQSALQKAKGMVDELAAAIDQVLEGSISIIYAQDSLEEQAQIQLQLLLAIGRLSAPWLKEP